MLIIGTGDRKSKFASGLGALHRPRSRGEHVTETKPRTRAMTSPKSPSTAASSKVNANPSSARSSPKTRRSDRVGRRGLKRPNLLDFLVVPGLWYGCLEKHGANVFMRPITRSLRRIEWGLVAVIALVMLAPAARAVPPRKRDCCVLHEQLPHRVPSLHSAEHLRVHNVWPRNRVMHDTFRRFRGRPHQWYCQYDLLFQNKLRVRQLQLPCAVVRSKSH